MHLREVDNGVIGEVAEQWGYDPRQHRPNDWSR
jgi:hypothetical protein